MLRYGPYSRMASSSTSAAPLDATQFSEMVASSVEKKLFLFLGFVALAYAFLAGLRTVSDYDLGWQMATGRWVAQHHQVPSVDLFSFTAHGQPWVYPVGAGLAFYAAFLLGGYALLSWMGAATCVGTVALLLRRGSVVSAAIAIIAVPAISARTAPRAEMFTAVLFAAFLSILWQDYRGDSAHLWLLPLLMIGWVNLHPGFLAGLALIAAFSAIEVFEVLTAGPRRQTAIQKLKRAYPWFVAAAVATLVNPWGWGIWLALLRQNRAMALHSQWLAEWGSVPLNLTAITSTVSLRDTKGTFYVLLLIAVTAAVSALLLRQLGAAVLLGGAAFEGARHVRMEALFACVVVVVGGSVLSSAAGRIGARISDARMRSMVATCGVLIFTSLAVVRSVDLVSNRHYFANINNGTFGAGLSWWFPVSAAEFIQQENLPEEIFSTYDLGGYFTWKLGPERLDYIDGRALPFGPEALQRHDELLRSSPDSAIWQQEANKYNINTILLPLARYDGVQLVNLAALCNSQAWRLVYLDEVSGVFVRRTPQTEGLVQRSQVDCATAPLPMKPAKASRAQAFNHWANAASLLGALGRNAEALAAAENALAIFPDSAFLHWVRANTLFAMGRLSDSEDEYLKAVALDPSEVTWSALANSYMKRGRVPAALTAMRRAAELSLRPQQSFLALGYAYLSAGQPKAALRAFDDAVRSAPMTADNATGSGSFPFMLAQGRSGAWQAIGDAEKATAYQEEAARLTPDVPAPWRRLAKLYQLQGRDADANRAREHAAALERH